MNSPDIINRLNIELNETKREFFDSNKSEITRDYLLNRCCELSAAIERIEKSLK